MWLVSCCTPLLYWGVFTHKKGASHNQPCPQLPFGSVCRGEEFEQKLELMLKIRLSVSKCRTDPTLQTAGRNRSDIHGWIIVSACVCQERLCRCLKTHYLFFAVSSPGISPLQTRWGSAASLAGVPHPRPCRTHGHNLVVWPLTYHVHLGDVVDAGYFNGKSNVHRRTWEKMVEWRDVHHDSTSKNTDDSRLLILSCRVNS